MTRNNTGAPRLIACICAFFVVSLYVKLRELALTQEYHDSVHVAIPWSRLTDGWYAMVFAREEALVFFALIILAMIAGLHSNAGGIFNRALTIAVWGVLPVLSAIEVLGLTYYATYQTPLPAAELIYFRQVREIVGTSGVWASPRVLEGLVLGAVTYLGAFRVSRTASRRSLNRLFALTASAATLILGVGIIAPRPVLAGSLLSPHPSVWFFVGRRPAFEWLPSEDVLAPTGTVTRAYSVTVRPKNIVLVILESTPAKSIFPYREAAHAGRRLFEEFSDDIVVFDSVYSPAPSSAPSFTAVSYGERPLGGGELSRSESETFVEVLHRRGFHTELYFTGEADLPGFAGLAWRGADRVLDRRNWPGQEHYSNLLWGRDDRLAFDEMSAFVDRATVDDPPFFLLTYTANTHAPYELEKLPGKTITATPREAHERLVEYDVNLFADFYRTLRRSPVADRTAVLVFGDHGEAFDEHTDNIIQSKNLYDENVHVPCLLLASGRLGLPAHIRQLGSLEDIRATVFDLFGMQEPAGHGLSLLFDAPQRIVFSATNYGPGQVALRDARYTYVLWPSTKNELLFDRDADPDEKIDVAARRPDVAASFRRRLLQ